MTLRTVLLSLQALLSAAEPDDPQDAVVATQYKENHEMFVKTAKHWAQAYAQGININLNAFVELSFQLQVKIRRWWLKLGSSWRWVLMSTLQGSLCPPVTGILSELLNNYLVN